MTTTIRNEAVDRMMEWINSASRDSRKELGYLFGAALAAERHAGWLQGFAEGEPQHARATVERIRERYYAFFSDEAVEKDYAFHPSVIFRILDEQAAR